MRAKYGAQLRRPDEAHRRRQVTPDRCAHAAAPARAALSLAAADVACDHALRAGRVYLACIWVAGVAIVLMSLIIPWGVFTRYVLGSGSQWPEPIAILLMVVFTFLGAARGLPRRRRTSPWRCSPTRLPPSLRNGCCAARATC